MKLMMILKHFFSLRKHTKTLWVTPGLDTERVLRREPIESAYPRYRKYRDQFLQMIGNPPGYPIQLQIWTLLSSNCEFEIFEMF